MTASTPMLFEPAAAGRSRTRTFTGTFTGVGTPDWHYVPVQVPRGGREIEVSYDYDSTSIPIGMSANVIGIGMFDPSGHDLGNASGFRGWSGGARRSFRISRAAATPGYLPGPITPGAWHVILGPVAIVPPGVDWTLRCRGRHVVLVSARTVGRVGRSGGSRRSRWYRGDLHLHTVNSDGQRTPAQMVRAARAAGLDFFASTEHNTSSASLRVGPSHTR
ncbi:MAG TPA: hypothetical protein VK964_12185 [Nocardioidaceae bacterium]|nr:hypothetical protein [Nocardioidaceae bacterium]